MKKYRYTPLTQQPYCCVPTIIQIVLLRRNMQLFSQEEIGYELGLTVPKKYKRILPKARTGKKPPAGWGTQVQVPKYSINHFFKKFKLPLKEEYSPVSKIKNIKQWIKKQLEEDKDLIVCFNYGKLYSGKGEHVSLLESIHDNMVILVDSEQKVPKYRTVKLNKLIEAMKYHEKKQGGFWIISKK